jgi:hypothetical protein
MISNILNLSFVEILIILLSPMFIWMTLVIDNYIKKKEWKIFGYEFSVIRYVVFMIALSIPFILFIIFTQNYELLLYFLLAGFAGVLGEVILSYWWRNFFWRGFWDYKYAAVLRGDTSLLNFPAWGIGGLLVLFTYNIFRDVTGLTLMDFSNTGTILDFILKLVLYFGIGFVVSIVLGRLILKKDYRGKMLLRYSLFVSGVLIFIFLVVLEFGFPWLYLFITWGLVCFVTEYLFGKGSVKFISKKLWLYNYLTIDNDHTSLLNILPFALGGYYFFGVYLLVVYLVQVFV